MRKSEILCQCLASAEPCNSNQSFLTIRLNTMLSGRGVASSAHAWLLLSHSVKRHTNC
jgi:hypothetical protein